LQLARNAIPAGEALPFRVTLTNTGTVAADEVVKIRLENEEMERIT
jgi:uncharacterized repeat protein (TIGR01451 family)